MCFKEKFRISALRAEGRGCSRYCCCTFRLGGGVGGEGSGNGIKVGQVLAVTERNMTETTWYQQKT